VCAWRNTQGDGPAACPPVCFGPSICGWGLNLSWKRRFDDPIVLPDGRQLVTLQDAGGTARGGEADGVTLREGPVRAACIGRRKEKATH
jgi:hypothetical protein